MKLLMQRLKELSVDKRFWAIFLIFALLTFLYFSVPITIFPDSVQYFSYQKILNGLVPLSSWDVIRGPSFPIIIFLFISVFSSAMFGILMGTYLFFIGLLAVFYLALYRIIKNLKVSNPTRIFAIICFFGLIVFNPIIFGYYHTFLTEFVASFLALIFCLLVWRWMQINFVAGQKIRFLIYGLFFAAMFVFVWFLKQPYITIVLFPLLIASCLSIANHRTLRNVIQRTSTVLVCVVCLWAGIAGWRAFLVANGVSSKVTSSADSYYLSGGIIKGLSDTSLSGLFTDNGDFVKRKLLSASEKDMINAKLSSRSGKGVGGVRILTVTSTAGTVIDEIPIYQNGADFTVKDASLAWTELVARHPIVALNSYSSNYLAAIDFYGYSTDPVSGTMKPIRKLGIYGHENHSIGMAYAKAPANMDVWTLKQITYPGLEYIENKPNIVKKIISKVVYPVNQGIFMMLFLLLPAMLVYSVFGYLALRKGDEKNGAVVRVYELAIILFGFGFLHALFNIFLGAMLDRYLFTAFPEVALGFIIILITNQKLRNIINKVGIRYVNKKT